MALRPIPLLTGAIGVVGANSLVLSPIAAAVADDLAARPTQVLQAAAAYGFGTMISALVLAPRADRTGPDVSLRQALAILVVALTISIFAPNVYILMLAQGIAGIGAGMALPAIYSLAPQMGPKGQEKKSMGTVLTGWVISIVGGVTLSAFLTDWVGWRAVYVLLTMLTIAIYILLRSVDMRLDCLSETTTSPFTALRVPGIGRALLSGGLLMLAFYGTYSFIGAHIVEHLKRSTSAAGIVTLFYGMGFWAANLADHHLDRVHTMRGLSLAFSAMVGVYLIKAAASVYFLTMLPAAFLWGITQHIALNLVLTRLSELGSTQRGAIMGLNSAVTYAAVMGGALLFALPYTAGGVALCMLISAAIATIGAAEAFTAAKTD